MKRAQQWIAFTTIVRKEMVRIFRIWVQTLLPPVVTTVLYFLIFGHVIGQRIGTMEGHQYIQFIAPGLIMMQVITSAYSGSASSLYSNKFVRSIEELLVSPMANWLILLGYMSGGMVRGLLSGSMVAIIALLFTPLSAHNIGLIIFVAVMTAAIFSLGGVINAVYANNFEDISIVPNFILTPLTYLGGVFYSVHLLPPFWEYLSYINPIVYLVSAFRYSLLGVHSSTIVISITMIIVIFILLFLFTLRLFVKGARLRQ